MGRDPPIAHLICRPGRGRSRSRGHAESFGLPASRLSSGGCVASGWAASAAACAGLGFPCGHFAALLLGRGGAPTTARRWAQPRSLIQSNVRPRTSPDRRLIQMERWNATGARSRHRGVLELPSNAISDAHVRYTDDGILGWRPVRRCMLERTVKTSRQGETTHSLRTTIATPEEDSPAGAGSNPDRHGLSVQLLTAWSGAASPERKRRCCNSQQRPIRHVRRGAAPRSTPHEGFAELGLELQLVSGAGMRTETCARDQVRRRATSCNPCMRARQEGYRSAAGGSGPGAGARPSRRAGFYLRMPDHSMVPARIA